MIFFSKALFATSVPTSLAASLFACFVLISLSNVEAATAVGTLVAKRALALNIEAVVFDRGGYLYHGRVKALADAARAAGLKF